jgi:nucleoside-diphosphate-sugar epimerase
MRRWLLGRGILACVRLMTTKPLDRQDLDHVLQHAAGALASLRSARLFLTGGTGFFGHWLLEPLLHANRELQLGLHATVLTRNASRFRARSPHIAADAAITLVEGDIASFRFPIAPFSHILHAATDSGGQQGQQTPYTLARSIVGGTQRVLEFAGECGASRLLYVSSGAVYGRATTLLKTPETFLSAPDPLALGSSYDEAKRMSETLCVAFADQSALQPVLARCFAFVGPHLPLDAHFAIGNFLRAAMRHEPIVIHSDGTARRSWLYMAAAWLITLLVRGQPRRAYNVGSDHGMSIAEAARLTAATLQPGTEVRVEGIVDLDRPLNSYVPAIDRARSELGLDVWVPLEEALRRTAAWYTDGPKPILIQ